MLASALLCAGLVLAQDVSENKLDIEDLQGTWDVQADSPEGAKAAGIVWKFKGKEYVIEAQTGKAIDSIKFEIDATKEPKRIDRTSSNRTIFGIYKLDSYTLTILSGTETKRPTSFDDKEGKLTVLKRRAN